MWIGVFGALKGGALSPPEDADPAPLSERRTPCGAFHPAGVYSQEAESADLRI